MTNYNQYYTITILLTTINKGANMDNETITLIYEIEEEINRQKTWIEIANIICENDDCADTKIYLILDNLHKQNENIYSKYEMLIGKIQN